MNLVETMLVKLQTVFLRVMSLIRAQPCFQLMCFGAFGVFSDFGVDATNG